ncbi:MAG TPA: HAMP domain-containing sensor histidine kinase [Paludibacteraceae bacterium]|nr:HAMP domain-containing sensor histidine kinase [Paludibacteraceae bacterium]HOS37537.1 HAMP domain-containing sensor histidine kinase [Paludibacteraceae bacterium]HPK20254.1 HAMP domain-containing sensor histidine kinase [Paludibacteraceae bacterium]
MKSYRLKLSLICMAFFLTGALGYLFEHVYYHSGNRLIPFEIFKNEWKNKEEETEKTLDKLSELIADNRLEAVTEFDFKNHDIGYYIFKNDNLVYWSNNQLGILTLTDLKNNHFCALSNAYCVTKSRTVGDYTVLGVIKIKNNYKSTNSYIKNNFAKGFRLDSNIGLNASTPDSPYALTSNDGKYLFSLVYKDDIVSDDIYAYLSLTCWWLCVGFFFLSFYSLSVWASKRSKRPFRTFLFILAIYTAIVSVLLHINVPHILFGTTIFSPIYYGSGTLLSSLGHLLIVTVLFCTTIVIFYFHIPLKIVRKKDYRSILYIAFVQIFSICIFLVLVWLFADLNDNSSVELSLYSVDHLSPYSVIAYLLVLCWITAFVLLRDKCIALIKVRTTYRQLVIQNIAIAAAMALLMVWFNSTFFAFTFIWYGVLCCVIDSFRFSKEKPLSYQTLALAVFVFSLYVSWFIYSRQDQKRIDKYQIVAENMVIKGNGSFDIVSESILKDVEDEIKNDGNLRRYLAYGNKKIANEQIVHYLTKYYFKNYWDAYNINVQVLPITDQNNNRYNKLISDGSVKLYNTNYFYCSNQKDNPFDYLGVFSYPNPTDTTMLYVELYAKERINYGYSDAVLDKSERARLNISSAKYEKEVLQWQWGKFEYPNLYSFPKTMKNGIASVCVDKHKHYFFSFPNDTHIVISEERPNDFVAYILFWTYIFSIYLAIVFVGKFVFMRIQKIQTINSLFTKIRIQFIWYIVASLAVVFCISILYINEQNFSSQRKHQMTITKYIKFELERFIVDNDSLPSKTAINFFLHDLSKLYETDIHLYNASGELISTSVPYIFAKGFASKLINPNPYFGTNNHELIQTEYIGSFKYLASYLPVIDTDGRIVAYVCLPSFLSYKKLASNLFNLLAIFLLIYFVFIVLSSIIGVFLSKRLSRPIKTIEEKLRAVKLGKQNEKIDYQAAPDDEIGMLIVQYNQMVDQLAESAELLAQSERELAWREMAQQIAHEIKNPLTPMKLTIQQLQRAKNMDKETFDNYFEKTAGVLIEQIDNLSSIASEFSNFARMPAAKLVRINIVDKLIAVVNLFKNNYEETDIVYLSTIEKAFIKADKEQMTQLFNNLLKNAIQSIPPDRDGKIRIELDITQNQVVISVSDNGTGIPPAVQAKLFTPNFTTKSSGMGLGLSIVKSIVTTSHGEISFTTQEGEGTKFIVKFPLVK